MQNWEYQPLGPFLAKSFATTVTPWVVTLEALEPFRVPAVAAAGRRPGAAAVPEPTRPTARTAASTFASRCGSVDAGDARRGAPSRFVVSRSNARDLYWTIAQMVTHHSSNGCNLRPGDLIASGTVSGPAPDGRGCLLERTWRGTEPLALPGGETRRFLEDGDEVILRGRCEREGFAAIGFGECRGMVVGGASQAATRA